MPESKSGALPLGDSPRETVRAREHQREANDHSGWRFSARATNPAVSPAFPPVPSVTRGIRESACRAAYSEAKAANTLAPDPVIRAPDAGAACDSAATQPATSGNRAATTACRSLRPYPSEKTAIFADSLCRVNSGAAKMSLVETLIGGDNTTNQVCGRLTGSSTSPTPRARAVSPNTKKGTSAPRSKIG